MTRWVARQAPTWVVAVLAANACLWAWRSWSWRATLDLPVMAFFAAQGLDFGLLPYRDLFDVNWPLSCLPYALVLASLGGADWAWRVADLAQLALLVGALVWAQRDAPWPTAWAGPLAFAGLYLASGPQMAFERDGLMLLPAALGAAWARSLSQPWARGAGAGLGLALAMGLKPGAIFLAPALAWAAWQGPPRAATGAAPRGALPPVPLGQQRRQALGGMGLGFVGACAVVAGWMAAWGMLGPFVGAMQVAMPLYAQLSGDNLMMGEAGGPWAYRGREAWAFLRAHERWLLLAALGSLSAALAPRKGPALGLAVGWGLVALGGLASAVAAGKFFEYHWLPWWLGVAGLGGLALAALPQSRGQRALCGLGFLLWLWAFHPSPDLRAQAWGGAVQQAELQRVDAIEAALRPWVRPGDSVQVLDFSNGGAQVAWRLGLRSATPFVQDFWFELAAGDPRNAALRERFFAAWDAAPPHVVLAVDLAQARVLGQGSGRIQAALEARLKGYRLVAEAQRMRAYLRPR